MQATIAECRRTLQNASGFPAGFAVGVAADCEIDLKTRQPDVAGAPVQQGGMWYSPQLLVHECLWSETGKTERR